jgi:hypothetical protein
MPPTEAPAPPASSPTPEPKVVQPFVPPPAGEEQGRTAGGTKIVSSGVKDGQPPEATDFKAAGKAFLASLQQGERTVAEEITATVQSTQAPGARVHTGTEEEGDEGEEEPIVAKPGELAWDEKAHRWRDERGAFVKAEPPTADERAAAGAPPAAEGEEEEAPAPSRTMFTLPGLAERGEQDIEVELSDPEVVKRLERLRNEGMRRHQFDDAMKDIGARENELRAVEEALTVDPVGFALNAMTRERQLEVAKALLVEHFDQLQPDIDALLDDPVSRANNRVALRDRLQQSRDQLTDHRARMNHAMACIDAARAMVPEGIDDATVDQFLADAEQDLIRAARDGRNVAPDTVASLLERRAALYGFDPIEPTGNGQTRRPPSPGSARPLTPAAQAIADRKKAEARETQQRVRRVQIARRSAASVTPPGVGAATVEAPVIPADADVREVSKILRRRGVANSWLPTGA